MEGGRSLVSVGIDIGTTTTQVVFSRLSLVSIARPGQIPRLDIADREILHESQIVFTPLIDAETIDAEGVATFVRSEYEAAGLRPEEVETGAAIITGETARKKNADLVLAAIADLAGDFVVTVAGPKVEGLIAARGSGAAAWSRKRFASVVNLDIGGGSANGALFRLGEPVASAAMNFGGRVIELEGDTVRAVTAAGRAILAQAGLNLEKGDRPSIGTLRKATDAMADLAFELAEGRTSALAEKLYQTPPLPTDAKPRNLMFSGGIGWYVHEPVELRETRDVSRHDDVGPLLAESIRLHQGFKRHDIIMPLETRRATVLGASSQTLALSGSTIWAEASILPLKNVPVVRVAPGSPTLPGAEELASALAARDLDPRADAFALSLEMRDGLDWQGLQELARGIADFAASMPTAKALILITKHDYAQSLGQTLKGLMGARPLLVIDQVGLDEGDFVDIGEPLMDGRVVPLVVKTLIFYH